jgi:D-glycero-D-manno-heptose 1,7-bisphosphate phosphatase
MYRMAGGYEDMAIIGLSAHGNDYGQAKGDTRCNEDTTVRTKFCAGVSGQASQAGQAAIFVMRDRLICEEQPGCVLSATPPPLAFGALEGLNILARLEAPVVLLMEQARVSHSEAVQQALELRHLRLAEQIVAQGGRCDGVYACPHWPGEACDCHPPSPTLLTAAAQALHLDLAHSALICDTWNQAYAALSVGCQPILVMTACGRAEMALPTWAELRARTWYAADLVGAALCIEATLSGQRLWQSLQPSQLAQAG